MISTGEKKVETGVSSRCTDEFAPMPSWEFASYGAIVTLFSLYYTWRICSVVFLEYDTGLISIGSELLSRGGLLYTDLHTIMLPGSYLWLALLFKLFGATALTCQITTVLTIVGTGLLILLISRRVIDGWLMLIPASIALVMGPYFAHFNSHHWDSLFLFLLYSLLLLRLVCQDNPPPAGLYGAGFLAGLSILCYQNQIAGAITGSFAVAAVVHTNSKSLKKALSAFAWLWAGVLTVLSSLAFYLISTSTLKAMLSCTIGFVVNNYSTINKVPYGYSNVQDIIVCYQQFPWSLFASTSFGIIKCAPAVVLAGLTIYFITGGSLRSALRKHPQIITLVALALGLWLGEFHKPDIRRLLWGCPLMFVLAFYFAERAKAYFGSTRLIVNAACLAILVGLLLNARLFMSLHPADAPIYQTRRGNIRSTGDLSILQELASVTKPYEKVFVYPYDTGLSFLAKTRFPSIFPVVHYRYHTDDQIQAVIDDLERSRVRYVVWNLAIGNCTYSQLGLPNYVPVPESGQTVEKYLLKHYDFAGSFGNYRLMRRKEAQSVAEIS